MLLLHFKEKQTTGSSDVPQTSYLLFSAKYGLPGIELDSLLMYFSASSVSSLFTNAFSENDNFKVLTLPLLSGLEQKGNLPDILPTRFI